jgi:hypothetical protein
MISLLPIPGGFFTLASRCLSPAIVHPVKQPSFLMSRVLHVDGRIGLPMLYRSQHNLPLHRILWPSGFRRMNILLKYG